MRDIIGPGLGYILARFILLPGLFSFLGIMIFANGVFLIPIPEYEILGMFMFLLGLTSIVSAIIYTIFLNRVSKFFIIVCLIQIITIIICTVIQIPTGRWIDGNYYNPGRDLTALIGFPIAFLLIRAFPGIVRRR